MGGSNSHYPSGQGGLAVRCDTNYTNPPNEVLGEGFEPSRPFEYQTLNLACLPVSPPEQSKGFCFLISNLFSFQRP